MTENKINLIKKEGKVWNFNFFLLWQGQFISSIGDFVYQVGLGFWVLAVTGSTALMATLMAATLIPQVIVSPIAGVFIDRVNRKWIIVLLDIIRGIAVLFVAIASFMGFLKTWMILVSGIILGICFAFFNPAIQASIPDLIPKSKLIKANAAFSMLYAFSKIVGDTLGGFLYQMLGVSLIFFVNSLSYLFSAFSEIFIKIPDIERPKNRLPFFEEMKLGFFFTWKSKGLRYLFLNAMVTNFFRMLGIILILPLFQQIPGLGPAKYGIVVGTAAAGAFAGFLITSLIHIHPSRRFFVMCMAGCLYSLCRVIFPFFPVMKIMIPLMFVSGVGISTSIILFESSIPLAVPAEKRGRVFSLLNTVSAGVWPFGMIVGGLLAEFIDIPILISTASAVSFASFFLLSFVSPARNVVNKEPI